MIFFTKSRNKNEIRRYETRRVYLIISLLILSLIVWYLKFQLLSAILIFLSLLLAISLKRYPFFEPLKLEEILRSYLYVISLVLATITYYLYDKIHGYWIILLVLLAIGFGVFGIYSSRNKNNK